jgi:hypothetical protein
MIAIIAIRTKGEPRSTQTKFEEVPEIDHWLLHEYEAELNTLQQVKLLPGIQQSMGFIV